MNQSQQPNLVAGAVLAGGASRRMGADKAHLMWQGRSLIRHQVATLSAAGCEPVLQVGGMISAGLEYCPDRQVGQGPVGGLMSVLAHLHHDWVCVVACDLPLLRPGTMRRLIQWAASHPQTQVVVATTQRVEPLCAVWNRARVLPVIERLWSQGERSLRGVLAQLNPERCSVPTRDLMNVNTPADLVRAGNVDGMVEEISVQTLAELLPTGVTVIDVREPDEYVAGHVPGAKLVPLGSILAGEASFDTAERLYMVCRSGARSMRACEMLDAQGVGVVNVAGGTLAWIANGSDVVEGMEPA